ncbi:MAG: STAS domain-containing protein [Planctomycetes bacterium]|jgi:anti-anti-sigma factor|nr:STAS domain-containing protein [Planctomycetota bacterium]
MWRPETSESNDNIRVLTWSPQKGDENLPDQAMRELDAIIAKDPGRQWILDVAAISILSSNAIAQLIGVVRRVSQANGHIALAKPPPAVATVLKMTRLTRILPIFEDIAAARASFT